MLINPVHSTVFYAHRYHGFHGYETCKKPHKITETPEFVRFNLEKALHKAYAEPSFKAVLHYATLQKRHMRKSKQFARIWERVLWAHPELDERSWHPVAQKPLHVFRQEDYKATQNHIQKNAQNFMLLICIDDQSLSALFINIALQFASEHNWSIRFLTEVNVKNAPSEMMMVNSALIKQLSVRFFPSIFLIHKNQKIRPLGAGCLSLEDLTYRVKEAMKDVIPSRD